MKTLIENGRLVLPDEIRTDGWVLLTDGKISALGQGRRPGDYDRRVDAGGAYITPGFLDMHLHGAAGFDFMDATEEAFRKIAETHMRHGTTSLLPTTMSSSMEELLELIACYKRVKKGWSGGPELLGLHLEGPFLSSAQAGAQDPRYLYLPLPENYLPVLEAGGSDIRRVSAAAELEGALGLGDALRSRGILAAIAHSDAEYEQVLAAIPHGFTHLTHFYSGMSSLHRVGAYRHLGVVESAYLQDELTVEIIADGKHLPPELLRLILKGIGIDRISLITDAMRGTGLPEGSRVKLGSQANGQMTVIEDGVAFMPDHSCFAGSVCTADRCIRVMVQQAGVSLPQAVRMMTGNPARLLGLERRKGMLAEGMDADLCLLDEKLQVQGVFVAGVQTV